MIGCLRTAAGLEPYAREVLSVAPGVRSIELSDPALVPLLAHIPSVRAMTWSFPDGHGAPGNRRPTPLASRGGLRIADFGRHRFAGAEILGPGSEILTRS